MGFGLVWVGSNVHRFSDLCPDSTDLLPGAAFERDPTVDYQIHKAALYTMATCHSLRAVDSQLVGDPLDVKMFKFTGWSFEEDGPKLNMLDQEELDSVSCSVAKPPAGKEYDADEPAIAAPVSLLESVIVHNIILITTQSAQIELRTLKSFEFVSHLRRASVLIRHAGANDGTVYVKGAPECMKEICNPKSCKL